MGATQVQPATDATRVAPAAAMAEPAGPRRRTGAYIALLLILLALLGGVLFLLARSLGVGSGGTKVAVPNVIGLAEDDANRTLTDAGFVVDKTTQPNDNVDAG